MNFWRAVEILNKRKWLIMFSVIATIVFTFGGTRLVASKWQATVRFVAPQTSTALTAQANSAAATDQAENEGPAAMAAARNQANVYEAMVKSRSVLEPVLDKLHQRELPPNFLKNVEFAAVGPKLFELHVIDSTPVRAEEYANALADQFEKVNHDLVTERARKVVKLLEDQVSQAEKKAAETRTKYDNYRAQHEIVGAENHNLELALSRLRDARQRRDEIAQMLAESQAELEQNRADLANPTPAPQVEEAPVESDATVLLRDQLAQADDQLSKLRLRYTEQNDAVKKAVAAREEIASKLKTEQERAKAAAVTRVASPQIQGQQAIVMLKHTVAGYRGQLAALDVTVRNASNDIGKYKGVDGPLAGLVTELNERTETSSNLKLRLHSARMALDVVERQNPITVMDRVSEFNPPINMTAGRTSKLIVMAALCALMATCGIVIGLDSIDRRLRNVKEAELVLPSKVLAAIPQPMGPVTYSSLARATEIHPQSIHSEAYRFLGLTLLNPRNSHIRSLMVLSAKAEQGSTTTLTNLGITLAQAGKRVIVVDANIRTAELHTVFGMDNDYGFTDVVRQPSRTNLDRAIRPTTVKNLEVMTSGTTPVNPWELFHDSHIHDLSHALHERADYVLYDTPSAAIFTDALNLAPVIDGAFLCVRALEQLTGAEQRMIEQIEQANVQLLGSVLTDVPAAVVEGYRNYQHYYQPVAQAAESAGGQAGSLAIAPSFVELPGESTKRDRES